MTTWRDPVVCECGHKGVHVWSENDQPYSKQWERHRFQGFEGDSFETDGTATLSEAVKSIQPKCIVCGAIGKISHAQGS